MSKASDLLSRVGLPARDAYDLPTSTKRFADGGQYRIEIPSTEGPRAMEAVLLSAAGLSVMIHRVSQGSGIMLQTDDEIREMVALGRRHGVEVCLFVGPRANWDIGIQAASTAGRVVGSSLRGADQLAFGIVSEPLAPIRAGNGAGVHRDGHHGCAPAQRRRMSFVGGAERTIPAWLGRKRNAAAVAKGSDPVSHASEAHRKRRNSPEASPHL